MVQHQQQHQKRAGLNGNTRNDAVRTMWRLDDAFSPVQYWGGSFFGLSANICRRVYNGWKNHDGYYAIRKAEHKTRTVTYSCKGPVYCRDKEVNSTCSIIRQSFVWRTTCMLHRKRKGMWCESTCGVNRHVVWIEGGIHLIWAHVNAPFGRHSNDLR